MNHEPHEKHEHGKLLYRDECYAIQGTIFEVNREMGAGFLEAVYQECLSIEFLKKGIPFVAQQELKLRYKGEVIQQVLLEWRFSLCSCFSCGLW